MNKCDQRLRLLKIILPSCFRFKLCQNCHSILQFSQTQHFIPQFIQKYFQTRTVTFFYFQYLNQQLISLLLLHTHTHTHFLAGTVLPNTFYLFTQTKITFYGTQRGTDYTIGSVRTIGHWPSSLRAQKIHRPITHLQPASVWGLLVGKLSSGCVILCITTRRGTINRLNKVYKGKT